MTIETVDAFVKAKVKPEFRPIVAAIRKVMRARAPKAEEAISYGMPVWKGKRIFAFIGSTKNDVKLGFSRGLRFEDKYKLLAGRGRASRHLRFKTGDEVKTPILGYYIRQALKEDAGE
jgi:uncharacterized protein